MVEYRTPKVKVGGDLGSFEVTLEQGVPGAMPHHLLDKDACIVHFDIYHEPAMTHTTRQDDSDSED